MPARPKSRITTACNSCRARKQKCSGNRGPAKGYIDALEHRLQETEGLLLGLLEQVSDSKLSSSITHITVQPRPGKRGSEYWKRFPLRSVEDIRSWQEDALRSAPERASTSNSTPNFDLAEGYASEVVETSPASPTLQEEPSRMQRKSPEPQASLSSWSGAPSTDFQQRFLW
ncbi:hypothetical protein BJY01DRAFT_252774 [Aspergillus pseudoustus]|uniref:Zn(2)-C6 fungal-type domain-containing protein n=1 Tax=Aspergillus pseudoustus TaxID=1810923 RepID=A0ABR4J5I0_9EURO